MAITPKPGVKIQEIALTKQPADPYGVGPNPVRLLKDGDIIVDQPGARAKFVETTFGYVPKAPIPKG